MFTTRNPREAEAFVDNLMVSEKFKQLIKDSFEVTTSIHDKIKDFYSANSKAAEKIFVTKMQSYMPLHQARLVNEIMINSESLDIDRDQIEMACALEAQLLALLQIGEEIDLQESELGDLRNYCGICEVALIESFNSLFEDEEEDEYDGLR